jgi:CRP-like cAMP-binding protein
VTAAASDRLREIALLSELDDAGLGDWAAAADERRVPAGAVVAEQGRPVDGLVLLLDGTAQGVLADGEGTRPANRIAAPAWLGAVSVLGETALPLGVVALTELRCAVVPAADCRGLVARHPSVLRRLMAAVGDQLAGAGAGPAPGARDEAARLTAQMGAALELLSTTVGRVLESNLPREAIRDLADLQQEALARADATCGSSATDRDEAMQALCAQLAPLDVAEPSWLAETLADAGLTPEWIDRVAAVSGPAADTALRWIAAAVAAHCRAADLRRAGARVCAPAVLLDTGR